MQNGSALAERMARNIGLLMKHESHLDKVADPSAGAYWIEQATARLVEAAWGVFLEVEEAGGLQAYAHEGALATALEQSWQRLQHAYQNEAVLVGVTKFKPATPQSEDEPYTVGAEANRKQRNLAEALKLKML
jgi:methylmalonyl-CoA mutase